MEFRDFEKTMAKFRPDLKVFPHGAFAGNEKNGKVSVIFNYGKPNESRVYDYYGSYAEILRRFDIECMSKDEFGEMLQRLETYRKWHGTLNCFTGEPTDCSAEIEDIENRIAMCASGEILVI